MAPARSRPPRVRQAQVAVTWPHGQREADPAREAWRLLFLLVQTLKTHFAAIAAAYDLSPVQARVLLELQPGTALPMSALADVLSCDASNVTGIVDRLEGRGLVERHGTEGDRRVKALATTRAGTALRRRLLERIARPPSVFEALPETDRKELARILGRTLANGT